LKLMFLDCLAWDVLLFISRSAFPAQAVLRRRRRRRQCSTTWCSACEAENRDSAGARPPNSSRSPDSRTGRRAAEIRRKLFRRTQDLTSWTVNVLITN
jgi:hypothetical protein